jgi:NodT family efflux transporter outer membrane factor (OMF) lipoprotein
LPSELLERRPDVAGAERRVAAANAQIGVAESAYYPTLSLSAVGGYSATNLSSLFSAPNPLWSLGASVLQTVFDGGLRQSQTDQAVAAYEGVVASYRQTVLTGLQEVEDNLAALRILEEEARVEDETVQAARQALNLVTNQYKAGTASALDVITAQAAELNSERNAADILSRRLTACVLLIQALGGGWDASSLRSNN